MKIQTIIAGAILLAAVSSCQEPMNKVADRVIDRALCQSVMMDARLADDKMPRSFADDKCIDSEIRWWCSGFFPGTLWYIYEYTGNEDIKAIAEKNTLKLKDLVELKTDHDIGFQINCSYGNAYRLTGDESYLPQIEAAAAKLATRFNPTVGCIKSWDNKKWEYPVIIDNMMNLELLMNASKLFSCDSLADVAKGHANTTMRNHFRDNASSFHLVSYSTETGEPVVKQTVQGYADQTSWSRGQAWGLYGYTMMARETGDQAYLSLAENIAAYIIPELPADGVPYWDFNAPGTPHAIGADATNLPENYAWTEGEPVKRDASAGAIIASALVDLSTLTADAKAAKLYLKTAERIIRTMACPEYLAEEGTNGYFVFKHSVGNLHGNSEVDVPLTYADYYLIEAVIKYSQL